MRITISPQLKRIARAIAPEPFRRWINHHLNTRRAARYSGLPIAAAFDEIYRSGIWSKGSGQLSGSGSYGEWARAYIGIVDDLVRSNSIHSIVDLGCGDFSVGAQLHHLVERYIAVDVSSEILSVNRRKYSDLGNVSFVQADGCSDKLPTGDLITIRQVLQHLTNRQIESILKNVESGGYRFALIAEHLPSASRMKVPNLDLPSHSPEIRTWLSSGVVPSAAPFSRPVQQVAEISTDEGPERGDRLCIYLWNLERT